MGRKFEQYDIYWLEEPVPATILPATSVSRALDMRVVSGETHFTRYDCGRSSQSLPADLQPDRCAAA